MRQGGVCVATATARKGENGEGGGRVALSERDSPEDILTALGAAFEALSLAVMVFSKDRRIVLCTPACEELTGLSAESLLAGTCSQMFTCEATAGQSVTDCLCPGIELELGRKDGVAREMLLRRPDGTTRWVRAAYSLTRGRSDRDEYVICILEDVTEAKHSTRKLLESRTRATLGQFTSELAHEVRNPLNAIEVRMVLLERQLGGLTFEGSDEIQRDIQVIREELKRLHDMVEGFLRFARSGQVQMEPQDLSMFLQELVDLVRDQVRTCGVELAMTVPRGLPRVMMDRQLLKQALLNLVLNALDAMPEGGTLGFEASVQDGEILLRVDDTGCGVPEEQREKVFELFHTTKPQGVGLGLPLAKNIVEKHGGKLRCVSRENGTRFEVVLRPEVAP